MIYFDNSATTFKKPKNVINAVEKCIKYNCGNPGRSGHILSVRAGETVFACRRELGAFFNTEPENIVFTLNTTYALNTLITPLLSDSDHVIISDIEHNAVLRPVVASGCEYSIVDMQNDDLEKYIKDNTKAIISNHASNLLPIVNPIDKIAKIAKKHSLIFFADCAQSAGVIKIDLEESGIDAICIPSHKSLYGIQGCGVIAFSRKYAAEDKNHFIYGGTGVNSKEISMPDFLPERYEAGTLPTPAIASLCEGIKEVKRIGVENIKKHEDNLYKNLKANLEQMRNVSVLNEKDNEFPILSFNVSSLSSNVIASELNRYGICVRGGYHCSPLAHKKAGTYGLGAIRVSFGIYNTEKEIEIFTDTLNRIVKQLML